jgi:hypothetical protein
MHDDGDDLAIQTTCARTSLDDLSIESHGATLPKQSRPTYYILEVCVRFWRPDKFIPLVLEQEIQHCIIQSPNAIL